MGAKNNPGKFDCYAKAEPDEPIFTLRAKDPRAPFMVELWAQLENGSIYDAVETFAQMVKEQFYGPTDDLPEKTSAKVKECEQCALDMRAWFDDNIGL